MDTDIQRLTDLYQELIARKTNILNGVSGGAAPGQEATVTLRSYIDGRNTINALALAACPPGNCVVMRDDGGQWYVFAANTSTLSKETIYRKRSRRPEDPPIEQLFDYLVLFSTNIKGDYATSGGAGVTTNKHLIGKIKTQVLIHYEMYTIPDKMDVYYDGKLIRTTGGLVSGAGDFKIDFQPTDSGGDSIQIIMTGGNDGTAWDYFVKGGSAEFFIGNNKKVISLGQLNLGQLNPEASDQAFTGFISIGKQNSQITLKHAYAGGKYGIIETFLLNNKTLKILSKNTYHSPTLVPAFKDDWKAKKMTSYDDSLAGASCLDKFGLSPFLSYDQKKKIVIQCDPTQIVGSMQLQNILYSRSFQGIVSTGKFKQSSTECTIVSQKKNRFKFKSIKGQENFVQNKTLQAIAFYLV